MPFFPILVYFHILNIYIVRLPLLKWAQIQSSLYFWWMTIRLTKIFFLWWWLIRINQIIANQLRSTNRLKNLNRSKPSTVPGGSTMMEPKNSFLNPLEIKITYNIIYPEKYSLKSVHSIYKETGVWIKLFPTFNLSVIETNKKSF